MPLNPDQPLSPCGPGAPCNDIDQATKVPFPVVLETLTVIDPVSGLYSVTEPIIWLEALAAMITF
jgi:hypothetical protein